MEDELRDLWGRQPVDPLRMSADELREKARRFETRTRLCFRLGVVVLAMLMAGYGSFFYFFPGTLQRLGSALALAGFVYGAFQLYRRGPARKVPPGPASETCAVYRAELQRQRDYCLSVWRHMAAFVPGPVVFVTGFTVKDLGPVNAAVLACLMITAPFAAGVPLNLREARKLQREIDSIDAMMRHS